MTGALKNDDIGLYAKILAKSYGQQAHAYALRHAVLLADVGDVNGHSSWLQVACRTLEFTGDIAAE